jgi:hypothetical protein
VILPHPMAHVLSELHGSRVLNSCPSHSRYPECRNPPFRGFPRNLNYALLSRNFGIHGFANPPPKMLLLRLPGSRIPDMLKCEFSVGFRMSATHLPTNGRPRSSHCFGTFTVKYPDLLSSRFPKCRILNLRNPECLCRFGTLTSLCLAHVRA